MTTAIGWVAAVLVVLVLLRLVVIALEPALAFFPSQGEDLTPASADVAYVAESIPTADGETLRAWWIPNEQARAAIVYFHGNGGNLSMWLPIYLDLHGREFSVFAVDYRGYGLSTGRPSEEGLYRDVEATVRFYRERHLKEGVPTIYWGRSLGTPMAARATRVATPDGVVLEAGFPHVRSVLQSQPILWALSWLGRYQFATAEWMRGYDGPVLVLHGTRDGVIAFRHGRALFEELATTDKKFVPIERGDHNDLLPADPFTYWGGVDAFVARLGR